MLSPTGNFRSFWDAIGILILVKAGIFGNLWEIGLEMGFFLGNLWSSGKSLVKQYASTFVFFFFSNRNNMKNKKDVNLDLL